MSDDGYGHDFKFFDELTQPLYDKAKAKFGKPSYHNFYPFKSPKGVWMAFHNTEYSDIRIINLETLEVVVDGDFYSHIVKGPDGKVDWYGEGTETVYASHTNWATYVPSYREYQSGDHWIADLDHEFEEDSAVTLENIQSIPLAFNAWTIWAADYEFYVDVIDLSDVDNGNISLLDCGDKFEGMSIPRGAEHIRNYINPSVEHWWTVTTEEEKAQGKMNYQSGNVSFSAQILLEHDLGRMTLKGEGNRGFRKINDKDRTPYPHKRAPWLATKEYLDEYRQKHKDKAAVTK